jgi:hypothetical protein
VRLYRLPFYPGRVLAALAARREAAVAWKGDGPC